MARVELTPEENLLLLQEIEVNRAFILLRLVNEQQHPSTSATWSSTPPLTTSNSRASGMGVMPSRSATWRSADRGVHPASSLPSQPV